MASITREITITTPVSDVWDALSDVGRVHDRLAHGFVTDTRLERGSRVVTFANGFVARELIVDVDDDRRRLAYAVVGSEQLTHHHATFTVHEDGAGSHVVWQADVLPDEAAVVVAGMMDHGMQAMKETLERR